MTYHLGAGLSCREYCGLGVAHKLAVVFFIGEREHFSTFLILQYPRSASVLILLDLIVTKGKYWLVNYFPMILYATSMVNLLASFPKVALYGVIELNFLQIVSLSLLFNLTLRQVLLRENKMFLSAWSFDREGVLTEKKNVTVIHIELLIALGVSKAIWGNILVEGPAGKGPLEGQVGTIIVVRVRVFFDKIFKL